MKGDGEGGGWWPWWGRPGADMILFCSLHLANSHPGSEGTSFFDSAIADPLQCPFSFALLCPPPFPSSRTTLHYPPLTRLCSLVAGLHHKPPCAHNHTLTLSPHHSSVSPQTPPFFLSLSFAIAIIPHTRTPTTTSFGPPLPPPYLSSPSPPFLAPPFNRFVSDPWYPLLPTPLFSCLLSANLHLLLSLRSLVASPRLRHLLSCSL